MLVQESINAAVIFGISYTPALVQIVNPLQTLAIHVSIVALSYLLHNFRPEFWGAKDAVFVDTNSLLTYSIICGIAIANIGIPATGVAMLTINFGSMVGRHIQQLFKYQQPNRSQQLKLT